MSVGTMWMLNASISPASRNDAISPPPPIIQMSLPRTARSRRARKPSALVAMRAMMRRLMCGLPAKCPRAAIINERTFTNQEQSKRAFRNPRLSDSRALPSTHDAGLITSLHFFFGIVFEPLLHRRLHVFPPLHTTASAQPAFLTDWDDGRSELGTKVGGTRADSYDIVGAPSISGGRNACTCGN